MLIKFNVDPAAFLEEVGRDEKIAQPRIQGFLEFWKRHGILATGTPQARADMLETLKTMEDQSAIALLIRALGEPRRSPYRKWESDRTSVDLSTVNTLPQMSQYGQRFAMAMLTDRHIDRLDTSSSANCPDDPYCPSLHSGNVSVVSLLNVDLACLVKALVSQEDWIIPHGATYQEIWVARLQPYAHYSHSIAMVDPFVVNQDGSPKSDLVRLLESLGSDPRVKDHLDVTIWCTAEDSGQATGAALASGLGTKFGSSKLSIEVNLFDAHDRHMPPEERFPRDRWIRFDEIIFKLHGVDSLGGSRPGDSCDMQQEQAAKHLVNVENDLSKRKIGKWLASFHVP